MRFDVFTPRGSESLIVTISRQYGAAAQAVARVLAARLACGLVDEELPKLIAARLGLSPDVVASVEDRQPGFGERVLAGLSDAPSEVDAPAGIPIDDMGLEYRREVERLIHAAARAGRVIILGRFGNAILGARPDVVRVFMSAPLAWRIANVQSSLRLSAAQAQAEIARIDEARRTFAREHYRMVWGEARNYDLTVNTARYGIEGSADVIAAAVHAADANA